MESNSLYNELYERQVDDISDTYITFNLDCFIVRKRLLLWSVLICFISLEDLAWFVRQGL